MHALQKRELEGLIERWEAGEKIRTVSLGHHPLNRQAIMYAWAFHLIGRAIAEGYEYAIPREHPGADHGRVDQGKVKPLHENFIALCDWLEQNELPPADPPLTKDELDGAESLAWVALTRGFSVAIAGYPEARYIEVSRV